MAHPIKLAFVDDLEPGSAVVIDADAAGTAQDISLCRDEDGTFYAIDDTCTHEEASLAEGWVEDGEIECPLHSARFCLKTGAAMCLPATQPVRTYPVEVREDAVWLVPSVEAADSVL